MQYSEIEDLLKKRDFKDVREKLEKEKIPNIQYSKTYIGHGEDRKHFDVVVKNFFKISDKNKVNNLKYLFTSKDEIKDVENSFPIDKLFEKYDLDNIQNSHEKIELLIPYIKELKYGNKMIEPLEKVLKAKYIRELVLTKRDGEKFRVDIYKLNTDEQTLEIIEPCQVFKNPIYGLLHYVNSMPELFSGKTIRVDNINVKSLNEYSCTNYQRIFQKMEFDDYEYELNIIDANIAKLTFYKSTLEHNKRTALLIIELQTDLIFEFNSIGKLLELLSRSNKYMHVHYGSSNNIDIYINGSRAFCVENSYSLFDDIMKDICDDKKPGIIASILGAFYLKAYSHDTIMRKDYYYNNRIKNQIIYELKRYL